MSEIKQGIALQWEHISYSVQQKIHSKFWKMGKSVVKQILIDVSGRVEPGEMLAILGPSGAGKTSLLDILAGRIRHSSGKISGKILMNGEEPSVRKFRQLVGYVKQEDIFMGATTVRETLMFSATLRLQGSISLEEKRKIVQEVIDELGLTKVADTKIGGESMKGISGGEQKRVSIGLELVKKAQILFLDEPTSGLDASYALSIIKTLKSLSVKDRTIICTLHQPRFSILKQFDKLMLLAQGQVVYFGPTLKAVDYFLNLGLTVPEHINPADFFMDNIRVSNNPEERENCVSEEQVQKLIQAYKDSDINFGKQLLDSEKQERQFSYVGSESYAANWFTQLKTIFIRGSRNTFRNPMVAGVEIPQYVLMGLILWMFWWNISDSQVGVRNRIGALLLIVMAGALTPVFSVVVYFPNERALFNREKASGYYQTSAYYIATSLATIPLQLFGTLILSLMTYWIVGFAGGAENFFLFLANVFLLALASDALGLFCSAVAPSFDKGNILAAFFVLTWLLFCGFFLVNSTPDYFIWIEKTSFLFYGIAAAMIIEFKDRTFTCENSGCNFPPDAFISWNNETIPANEAGLECIPICQFNTGQDVLDFYGFNRDLWEYILILASIFFIFRFLGYLILRKFVIGRS